jgi:hypothetical protein
MVVLDALRSIQVRVTVRIKLRAGILLSPIWPFNREGVGADVSGSFKDLFLLFL